MDFIANFLIHPVIAGFITASRILIALSQLKHIFGIPAGGHTLPEIIGDLLIRLPLASGLAFLIGAAASLFFYGRERLCSPCSSLWVCRQNGFHLAEVKGPIIDRLAKSNLLTDLSGRVSVGLSGMDRSEASPILRRQLCDSVTDFTSKCSDDDAAVSRADLEHWRKAVRSNASTNLLTFLSRF